MKQEGFGPPVVSRARVFVSSCRFALRRMEILLFRPADALRKMILIEPPRSTIAARREPLNKRELARFAVLALKAAGCSGSVSVLLTNDERIRELNREFRGKDSPTDVLSFPAVAWEFETDKWPQKQERRRPGDFARFSGAAGGEPRPFAGYRGESAHPAWGAAPGRI